MNTFLQEAQSSDSLTNNGAVTNSTSLNKCLDLFFLAGACREVSDGDIIIKLEKAYQEDQTKCLKIIFWAGDIRYGAGERRFFKLALEWLYNHHTEVFHKYFELVPEYSRWDSLFDIAARNNDEKILDFIGHSLVEKKDGLLAKWLPRGKQYSNLASVIRTHAKWSPKRYRKTIVELTKVVEQQMSKKEWDKIVYSAVPSVASNKYRNAFHRNDEERYSKFIEDCKQGKEKINASAIFPHDIYKSIKRGDNEAAINVQWNALPNYLEDSSCRFIPVCDVSGSMTGMPMDVSVSLGIYLSERNNSSFKDAFITFSNSPKIQYLKGSLTERARQLENAEWSQNTNIEAVFDLILKTSMNANVNVNDVPTHILIISDMEFDQASSGSTNFKNIKLKYQAAGLEMPQLVFWNVNGRPNNVPVNTKDNGVALVSGFSPSIIKSLLSGELNPMSVMNKTLDSQRYSAFNN